MRLCQKCATAVSDCWLEPEKWFDPSKNAMRYFATRPQYNLCPEADCQFWAHKEANTLNEALSSEVGLF